MVTDIRTAEQLQTENEALRSKLAEAEETLRAIRSGEVDALVVATATGHKIYTLQDADHSYRLFVEEMQEGAVTLSPEGTILYVNRSFASMVGYSLDCLISEAFDRYVDPADLAYIHSILAGTEMSYAGRAINLIHQNGEPVPIYLSVTVVNQNEHLTYGLVMADLRLQQKHDEKMLFMQNLGLVLSHADDLVSGFNKILQLICTRTRWAMGEIWLPRSSDSNLGSS